MAHTLAEAEAKTVVNTLVDVKAEALTDKLGFRLCSFLVQCVNQSLGLQVAQYIAYYLSTSATTLTLANVSPSVLVFTCNRGSAGVWISALGYTLTSVLLSVSASASVSVLDTMSTSALAYTSSTFFLSFWAFASDRFSSTMSTNASTLRSTSVTECVRLCLY